MRKSTPVGGDLLCRFGRESHGFILYFQNFRVTLGKSAFVTTLHEDRTLQALSNIEQLYVVIRFREFYREIFSKDFGLIFKLSLKE